MIKMLRHFWVDLRDDEKVAKRLTAAVFGGIAAGLGTCVGIVASTPAKVACAMGSAVCLALVPMIMTDKSANRPEGP